jgi:hypothetical protein
VAFHEARVETISAAFARRTRSLTRSRTRGAKEATETPEEVRSIAARKTTPRARSFWIAEAQRAS